MRSGGGRPGRGHRHRCSVPARRRVGRRRAADEGEPACRQEEGPPIHDESIADRSAPDGELFSGDSPDSGAASTVTRPIARVRWPGERATGDDLWETHADWWIDGFTDGADPEYDEQILPLARRELAGARRVLDVGCGDGQVSRLPIERRRGARRRRRPDVEPADGRRAAGRRSGVRPGGCCAACRSPDATFDAVVACLVFEHIRDVDAAIAEVARVLEPGGRFCFFLNHPLLQTPNSGWIDDQILDPPEQYWRIGDYLIEDETIEEVEKDVFIPFIHRPLSRYVNALGRQRPAARADGGAGAAAGLPRPGRRVRSGGHIPRLLYLRHDARSPRRTVADGRHPRHQRAVRRRALRGGRGARGPRLVRRRQPAHLAGRQDRRARERPRASIDRLALVAGRQHAELLDKVTALRADGPSGALLFLDADTAVLVRRYERPAAATRSTRRRRRWSRRSSSNVTCSSR